MKPFSVRLWRLETARLPHPATTPLWERLGPGEIARAERFVSKDDARDYAYAHALKRFALTVALGGAFEGWRFTTDAFGKPRLTPPFTSPFASQGFSPCASPHQGRFMEFSLSHAKGIVAVALSETGPVGVDVETLDRPLLGDELLTQICSADEIAMLAGLCADPSARHRALLRVWTRKEALAKAIGLGLGLPFSSVDVLRASTVRAPAASGVGVRDWTIEDAPAPTPFLVSLARLQTPQAPPVTVHTPTLEDLFGASLA